MKLVVDNTNISEMPIGNYRDMANMARRFADEIEAGQYEGLERILLIVDAAGLPEIHSWGEITTKYQALGLLEVAKMTFFADQIVDD